MDKIKIKQVSLTRVEGLTIECGKTSVVATLARADSVLYRWSHTAPKGGGYDKCEFTIVFDDGSTYSGRYDLQHFKTSQPSLTAHLRAQINYYTNTVRPSYMSDNAWKESCLNNEQSGAFEYYSNFRDTYLVA